jgi:DnaK suppressor protein
VSQRLAFLAKIKTLLDQKRDDLITKARAGIGRSSFDEKLVKDSGDEAQAIVMEKIESSLQMNDADELKLVERALDLLRRDEYGICVDCGEHISQKRLEHYPYAARCITCQEAFEG